MLLSDGVVEARSHSGELFGFDHTSRISRLAATQIAEEAHRSGGQILGAIVFHSKL
jgi:serine phosphatase RsbU (regulator of sigma subunit)